MDEIWTVVGVLAVWGFLCGYIGWRLAKMDERAAMDHYWNNR